jgi:hypothetical protein
MAELIIHNSAWDTRILDLKKPHQIYKLKNGDRVPGATTVLGELNKPALLEWVYKLAMDGKDYKTVRDTAADVGSCAHFICEGYLKGFNPSFEGINYEIVDKAHQSFKKFAAFWNREEYEMVHSELQLVSEAHSYGGTIDSILTDEQGNLVLMDIKTSKAVYPEMACQLAAYRRLYNENHNKKITRQFILRIGKEDPDDQELVEFSDDVMSHALHRFDGALMAYHGKKKLEAALKNEKKQATA